MAQTHSGRSIENGIRVLLSDHWYIGNQPEGPYRDWLYKIENLHYRLAGTNARLGWRNHSHLVRWYKLGWQPRDIVDRLQGRPFPTY